MKRRVAKFAARRPAARPATSRFDRANTNGQRAITIAISITIAITGFAIMGAIILAISFFCGAITLAITDLRLAITRANTAQDEY
jgi:cytochrome b561